MKILLVAVGLFFSITLAQESPQQDSISNSVSEATTVSDDEELILDDDDDIQKANQQVITTDTAQKISASAVSGSSKVINKADEDELKLDGGEENILEAVKQEKPVADTINKHNVTDADSALRTDTSVITKEASVDSGVPVVNSGAMELKPEVSRTDSAFVKKNAEPQVIGATGSINFARNLKDYRSPKIAMLMSLVIPGSGQVYAAHNSWKAAIYGAVEVGMISTGIALRNKGLKKEKKAHNFANDHYKLQKYLEYHTKLKNNVDSTTYFNIFPFGTDTMFQINANARNEDFYDDIKQDALPYVNGWDDAKPDFDDNMDIKSLGYYAVNDSDSCYLVFPGNDSKNAQYGFSDNQKFYSSSISKANKYFNNSKLVLTLMLLNHIVSAIDAGLSAKAHNDHLLNKQSVWQHLGIEQMYVSVGGTMAPGYALKVRF